MAAEEGDYDDLYWAVKGHNASEVGKVLGANVWDLQRHYKEEGNVVNIAIENADADEPKPASVLARILGLAEPLIEAQEKVTLPEDRDILLSDVCDSNGSLPLAKASAVGSLECVALLLRCGADVNQEVKSGLRAIDRSLDQEDRSITLLLLEKDSLFPRKGRGVTRWTTLQTLIKETEEFTRLFEKRDSIYRALCSDPMGEDARRVFESGQYRYYVDREGASVLYKAGSEKRYEAWAYLLAMDLHYGTQEEEEKVNYLKAVYHEPFNRALEGVFHRVEGCYVMKMVTKSLTFGRGEEIEGLGKRFESLYKALGEDKYTRVLLRVLQDVPNFEVVFDFGATNVSRMRAGECGRKTRGVTDFRRNRVYVAAMESDADRDRFSDADIVGNLAHELAHDALNEVFGNEGLPYRRGEAAGDCCYLPGGIGDSYEDIVDQVMSPECFSKCDVVIRRVKESYGSESWSRELIVRVPEMVAKYREFADHPDQLTGVERLETQSPRLLRFYHDHVIPECEKYVRRNVSGDRMTLRAVTDYQNLISSCHRSDNRVEVNEGTVRRLEFHVHNGLNVLRASNLPLAQSHVSSKHKKRAFFVDWSNYRSCSEMFLSGLRRRDFDLLAVNWDAAERPTFCNSQYCRESCLTRMFGDFVEWVVVLVHQKHRAPPNAEAVEYAWDELSPDTQNHHILGKVLDFGGKAMTVEKIIRTFDDSLPGDWSPGKHLNATDIAHILEEANLRLSKVTRWPSEGEEEGRVFLNHRECFIRRSLCRRVVELNGEILEKNQTAYFFVVDAKSEHLLGLGVRESYLNVWQGELSTVKSGARCHVLDLGVDRSKVYDIFESIIGHHSREKTEGRIYFLKFMEGLFFLVRSSDFRTGVPRREYEKEPIKSFVKLHTAEKLLDSSDFSTEVPVAIADNPGCGKTVYLNKLAMDIKKTWPDSWVAFIELSVKEQQKHLESLQTFQASGGDDLASITTDLLFQMVRSGDSSLEKKLFGHLSRRSNKIFALFDGFDEICPKYKDGVTAFLGAIRTHTRIKIIVTTRLHEKWGLEKALDVVSYALVPFSTDDQVKFLGRYWNALLKKLPSVERVRKMISMQTGVTRFISDETQGSQDVSGLVTELEQAIAKEQERATSKKGTPTDKYKAIDFKPVVRRLVESGEVFAEGPDQFTQTPLHVQMAGLTIYEDSFANLGRTRNLGHLYTRFFELKMRIFTREKAGTSGTPQSETLTKMGQRMASSVLENLSANTFQEAKVYGFRRNDMLVALSIGLVTESGGTYSFVHRSFGEFFFAKWLLRKAKKEDVTRFWLQRLFLEEWLSRVGFFLEDILRLLSEGVLSDDHDNVLLTQESCLLNERALPEPDIVQGIRRCLYAHVLDGQRGSLLHLADSFGERVVKHILDDQNSVDLGLSRESRIYQALNDRISKYESNTFPDERFRNVFTFSTYCLEKLTSLSTKRYIGIIRTMLELMDRFNLCPSVNELIAEKGLYWMFPSHVFIDSRDDQSTSAYLSLMVPFFIDHMDLFRDTLSRGFSRNKDTFLSIGRKDFGQLSLLANSAFRGLDFARFLLEETSVFFTLWTNAVFCEPLEAVSCLWRYLEEKLLTKVNKLKYLQRKGGESLTTNALLISSYNEDPRVIQYIWGLGTSLLEGPDERKSWLFKSYEDDLCPPFATVHRAFHKFLAGKMESGILSLEESKRLLLSTDVRRRHYLLDIHADAFPIPILSFFHLLQGPISGCAKEIAPYITFPMVRVLKWMVFKTHVQFDEDLWSLVEQGYEGITSGDKFNLMLPLPQEIRLQQPRNLEDLSVDASTFKASVVVLNERLKLDFQHRDRGLAVRNLSRPEYDPVYRGRSDSDAPITNILHHVVSFRNVLALRCVLGVLTGFVTLEEVKKLFLEVDSLGRTLLHRSLDQEGDYDMYEGLLEVGGQLLGEEAMRELKGVRDRRGNRVPDIISQREAEDAELSLFVDEFNAGR